MLQGLDILRRWIPAAIRRLVVGAVCRLESVPGLGHEFGMRDKQPTIAIYGAMGAWLLPIAFDLLAPTLITCPSHSSSFLHRHWLFERCASRLGFIGGGVFCVLLFILKLMPVISVRVIFCRLGRGLTMVESASHGQLLVTPHWPFLLSTDFHDDNGAVLLTNVVAFDESRTRSDGWSLDGTPGDD